MKKVLISALAVLALAACSPEPEAAPPPDADSFVEVYLGVISGSSPTRVTPGEYKPGTDPLEVLLGGVQ